MGSTLTAAQEKLLTHSFDEVTLMLDGDKAGREGTERGAAQLAGKVKLSIVTVPDGSQPDQLSPAAIRSLLEPENQRRGNRQNLPTAESPSLRRTPDEAKLEV